MDEQDLILQPIPEVSEPKRIIGMRGLELTMLLERIESIDNAIKLKDNSVSAVDLRVSYLNFYDKCRTTLRDIIDYVPENEQEEIDKRIGDIRTVDERLFQITTAENYCMYTKQQLKEANLTELGQKDEIPYIMEEIEIT